MKINIKQFKNALDDEPHGIVTAEGTRDEILAAVSAACKGYDAVDVEVVEE